MAPQTRTQLAAEQLPATRKRNSSLKVRENQAPAPSAPTKSKKRRPQRVTPEPESDSDEEEQQLLSSPPPADMRILDMNYELSLTSFLDNERVSGRFMITKLQHFSIRRHLVETIKLVEQHASKASKRVEWIRGEAELQHKGLSKANHPVTDVSDEDEWHEVEYSLEAWMKEGYKAIRVDLRLYYKTTGGEMPQVMHEVVHEATKPVNIENKTVWSMDDFTDFLSLKHLPKKLFLRLPNAMKRCLKTTSSLFNLPGIVI